MIFGTKWNPEIQEIPKPFLVLNPQIGAKKILKSIFLAIFHEISIFESQNTTIMLIWTWLLSFLILCF